MSWKNVQYENGKFKTGSGGGGGASALTDLSDVNISSASDGQVLKYDSTSSKWVNANESGGGHTYSTTEQVVGTWINRKPVYEKTFYYSETTVGSAVTKDISDLHIDEAITTSGTFTRIVSGYAPFTYAFNMYESPTLNSFARVSNTNNSDLVWRINAEGTDKQIIILRYTKTTD